MDLGETGLELEWDDAVSKGKKFHDWIVGNPTAEPRPSQSCTLKFHEIPLALHQNTPVRLEAILEESMGYVILLAGMKVGLIHDERIYMQTDFYPTEQVPSVWKSVLTMGGIFIQGVARDPASASPHASSILQAVYENWYPVQTLKHIFMIGVVNVDTLSVLPEIDDDRERTWPADTEEYFALLGSPLGKLVAHFVLGVSDVVKFRISAVSIVEFDSLRFDIEEVLPTQV